MGMGTSRFISLLHAAEMCRNRLIATCNEPFSFDDYVALFVPDNIMAAWRLLRPWDLYVKDADNARTVDSFQAIIGGMNLWVILDQRGEKEKWPIPALGEGTVLRPDAPADLIDRVVSTVRKRAALAADGMCLIRALEWMRDKELTPKQTAHCLPGVTYLVEHTSWHREHKEKLLSDMTSAGAPRSIPSIPPDVRDDITLAAGVIAINQLLPPDMETEWKSAITFSFIDEMNDGLR